MSHWRLQINKIPNKHAYVWFPWIVGPVLLMGTIVTLLFSSETTVKKPSPKNFSGINKENGIDSKRQLYYYEAQISNLDKKVKSYRDELDQVWLDNDRYEDTLDKSKDKLFKILAHHKAVLSLLNQQLAWERKKNSELQTVLIKNNKPDKKNLTSNLPAKNSRIPASN